MTTYVAQANTGSDDLVSSRSVAKPAGVAADDVGVFWLARWNESASFPAVTPPAGALLRGTITGSTIQTLCYLLKVNAEASFAFSWTSSRWAALSALFFSGVDPALDLSTVPFHSLTGSGTSISTLTVTTVDTAAMPWHVNTLSGGSAHTPPTSFTEVADVNAWAAAYRISPGDGDQSATGATLASSTAWGAGLVALAPAGGGGTAHTADASTAATATLTAAGTRGTAAVATTTATAGLAATATRATAADVALAATAGLDASAAIDHPAGASLPAMATLTAEASTEQAATAAHAELTALAELTATAHRHTTASATLAGTANLTATAAVFTSGDDIDVTTGPPHSPWASGAPTGPAWTTGAPHGSGWEVGSPA